MKINGKKIAGPNIEIVVLPRGDGENLVFKAQAVLNSDDFDKICPRPEPPVRVGKGGIKVQNIEDLGFKAELLQYGEMRMAWIILQSLKATEGLEWETVDLSDPSTWKNYNSELKDSGLAEMEISRIINCVFDANSLNEEKVKAARDSFLASVAVATKE